MVDTLNCIQSDFITTDSLGGGRVYSATTPIFLANNYYRVEISNYSGNHLSLCHISGRNSDSEPWEVIFKLIGTTKGSFISPKDYHQVRFFWNKNSYETGTRISYWIRHDSVNHKNAYVSNRGNDSAPGTIDYPYKTIAKALSMKPRNIYLCKGDTFYESFTLDGVNLRAYGEGVKPVISGLKILPDSAIEQGDINNSGEWTSSNDGCVWRINLAMPESEYEGYKVSQSIVNNIGTLVDQSNGKSLNCQKVQNFEELLNANKDWLMWQPTSIPTAQTQISNFNYLYVRYNGNLRQLRLGVTIGATGVIAQNCVIENVKVAYWGRHGIQSGSNLIIKDCNIDCIGGMIQIGYPSWVCLGNGIEFYITGDTHDSLVENCEISHCYDAGLTIQGSANKKLVVKNIILKNNVIRNCCQSYEEFLNGDTDDSIFDNCIFESNKSYDAGIDTGFGYSDTRYKKCHILSNSKYRNTKMIYRNNLFENGNFRCSGPYIINGIQKYDQGIWIGNTCKIKLGYDLIGNYWGTSDVVSLPNDKGSCPTIEDAFNNAIAKYRQLTNDESTLFEIIN